MLPSTFASDHLHYDKTPVGKGCHVLHRCVQATEWSRKTRIAGRDVADIRAFELSHRGLADFSFRLLFDGRHQSIAWARNGLESFLLTALLKKIRESGVSIDDAAQARHSAAVPDKHKEAMRFMEPLAQELLKCLEAKAPVKNHDVADELAKAKAKMAERGITMSPVKRKHDAYNHPVVVGFGTFDCLGKHGLEAIARPWTRGSAPIDRRGLRSWALGLTKSSDKMPSKPLGDVP